MLFKTLLSKRILVYALLWLLVLTSGIEARMRHHACYFEEVIFSHTENGMGVFVDSDNERLSFFIGEGYDEVALRNWQKDKKIDLYICGPYAVVGKIYDNLFIEARIEGLYLIKNIKVLLRQHNSTVLRQEEYFDPSPLMQT